MALTIPLTDLTNGTTTTDTEGGLKWTGTGVFDVLMGAVNENVKIQYDSGRIVGQDYAQVYLSALQSSVQAAIQFLLQEGKSAAEAAEVAANAEKQREVLQAQKELYKRQKAGFDDNKHQKILEAQLNAWGITFQDTDTTFLPSQLNQAGFTESFNAVRANYYDVCDDTCVS